MRVSPLVSESSLSTRTIPKINRSKLNQVYDRNEVPQVEPFVAAANKLNLLGSGEITLVPNGNDTI